MIMDNICIFGNDPRSASIEIALNFSMLREMEKVGEMGSTYDDGSLVSVL